MSNTSKTNAELPVQWQQVQSAIWLIGLAILAWQSWWFPGILVLVAISGLTQAAIQVYLSRTDEQKAIEQTRMHLPDKCPACGAPLSVSTVKWTGATTASCPFCGSNLKVQEQH
jgi:hypothetical protein